MNDLDDRTEPDTRERSGQGRGVGWRTTARTRAVPLAKRLAIREYIPAVAWMLSWLMIGLSVGHADAVRLLAANTFVQAARALLTMEVVQALARRVTAEKGIYRASRRLALGIDLRALAACALALGGLVAVFEWRGMAEAGAMIAVVALGLPARHPGALFVAKRQRDIMWRLGSATVMVGGAALVLALGLHWLAAAAVLALREWSGLVATWLFAPRRAGSREPVGEILAFREAASRTEASARRRLSYRMMKSLFGVVLGPFGNIAARTGRGAGRLDTKIANLIPRSRAGMMLLTGGTAAAATTLLAANREPASIMGAAALTRIAASGGAALLWWNYGEDRIVDDEDDED